METRREAGRAARETVPRAGQAAWHAATGRDALDRLRAADSARIPALLPLRYKRMRADALAYLRGTAALMAADLGAQPNTGLIVQSCGDAHLFNFGSYAAPDGEPVFDVNDFDETLPAPFEWDVKRLATSLMLAGRAHGPALARRAARAYRTQMATFAAMPPLMVWRSRVDLDAALDTITPKAVRRREQARLHDRLSATRDMAARLVAEDGTLRLPERPPSVFRLGPEEGIAHAAFATWLDGLPTETRALLDRFALRDVAFKAVGIGSVGTFCALGLFADADGNALILQLKQAWASVLEPFAGPSRLSNAGQRVVVGQRILQAVSDPLLGWSAPNPDGKQFYVRQLKDSRLASFGGQIEAEALRAYAGLCGRALARAHARGGDAATLAGYMGDGDVFEDAVAGFARSYAAQVEADFAAFAEAVDKGELPSSDAPLREGH